jgi:hypothetical protein
MVLGLAFGKIKNVFVGKFISEIKICWDLEIHLGQRITDSTCHGWVDFWHHTRPLEIDTLLRTAVIKKSWVSNPTGRLVSKLENGVDSKADPRLLPNEKKTYSTKSSVQHSSSSLVRQAEFDSFIINITFTSAS